MRYLITVMLLLIALNSSSQTVTRTDSVCFSVEVAAKIMADLDMLEICIMDVENLRIGYSTCKEEINILREVANTLYINNKELTEQINDTEAKNQQLKRKRIMWGIAGFAAGLIVYRYVLQ